MRNIKDIKKKKKIDLLTCGKATSINSELPSIGISVIIINIFKRSSSSVFFLFDDPKSFSCISKFPARVTIALTRAPGKKFQTIHTCVIECNSIWKSGQVMTSF